MYSPFTFDGDRQVVRSFEDSIALLSGMRFRDGKAVVSGKCGQEEKIELRIRAKQGSISSPLNLSNIGISQKHQGDEIVYYGSRTALSQLFGL